MAKKTRPTAEDKAFYEQAAQEYYDSLAKSPATESTLEAALRTSERTRRAAEERARASERAREAAETEIAALRAELDQLKKSK